MTTRLYSQSSAPHRVVAAALAAGTLLFGMPALAQGSEAAEVSVHYSRAALKSDAGAQAVYADIKRAARRACGQPGSRSLRELGAIQQCRQQAVARAVDQIDSPRLAAVHAGDDRTARVAGAGDMHTSR